NLKVDGRGTRSSKNKPDTNDVHKSGQSNCNDAAKPSQMNTSDFVEFKNQNIVGLSVYPTFSGFSMPPYNAYNGVPVYQSYSPYYYNVSNGIQFWNSGILDPKENRK
ncbi:hypothetical protein PIB30_080036, partial [Stylosanthes scabra]|nr:hypothetical protein [Stylosanthes scabra]